MARVTVEDCLEAVGNHFALAVLAAERARALAKGATPRVLCDNKPGVTALREIAAGKVSFNESLQEVLQAHIASTKALDGLRKRRRGDNTIPSVAAADRAVRAKK
jgi:DNA-directed RNA polymerase subunit omega